MALLFWGDCGERTYPAVLAPAADVCRPGDFYRRASHPAVLCRSSGTQGLAALKAREGLLSFVVLILPPPNYIITGVPCYIVCDPTTFTDPPPFNPPSTAGPPCDGEGDCVVGLAGGRPVRCRWVHPADAGGIGRSRGGGRLPPPSPRRRCLHRRRPRHHRPP